MKQSRRVRFGGLRTLAIAMAGLLTGFFAGPASAQEMEQEYVAFGDSYTSGIGAGPFMASPLYPPDQCFQASPGYPDALDALDAIELTANAACAGWTAAMVPLQVQTASAAGLLNEDSDLVTITAGGNDVGFLDLLLACLAPSPLETCKTEVRAAEALARSELPDVLIGAYAAIRAEAPNATIVVLGYPHLFSPEYGDQPYITEEAAAVFNKGVDTLNNVIRKAARQVPGTVYVDVTKEFEGHGLGSPDSWFVLDGTNASFHPNAIGYAEGYATAVETAL